MTDIETTVKRKIFLEEENKELKEKIKELQASLEFKEKQTAELHNKIEEASNILGVRRSIKFFKRKTVRKSFLDW